MSANKAPLEIQKRDEKWKGSYSSRLVEIDEV
jgi:hypothetical protein